MTNPAPDALAPGYSRLPKQAPDAAERLRSVFEDEARKVHPSRYPEVYMPGGHEVVLAIKVRASGRVTILSVPSSTHPIATRVCKRFLRESVFEPALDLKGRPKDFETTYSCQVSFGGIVIRW